MMKTVTATALALSLIAGSAFAQGGTTPAPTANAPITQPAKPDAKADTKTTSVKPATKVAKQHVRHLRHAKHVKHVKIAKHGKHIKHAKRVKQPVEKTRG